MGTAAATAAACQRAATRRRSLPPPAARRRAAAVEEIKCQPVFHTSLDTLLMILVLCKLDSQKPWKNIEC
jgi:hypothetical protein